LNSRKRRSLDYQGRLDSDDDNKVIRIGPIYPGEFAKNNSRPIVMIEPEYTTRLVEEIVDVVMENVNAENNNAIQAALMAFPMWSIILVIVGMIVTVLLVVLFVFNYSRKSGGGKM